jgi:DNA polymerase I-like protein with 3'-5' exonuclease and polymerase domains
MRLRLLPEVTQVYSEQQAAAALEYLMRRGGQIAIDSETTGLDKLRSRILFWSMATDTHRFFIPYQFLLFFDRLFRRTDITWFFANAKYDLHMFANMGCQFLGTLYDIVVMDALDDDTRRHGLKEQAKTAYDASWGEFKELFLDPTYVAANLNIDKKAFARFKKQDVGEKLLFVYDEAPHIVEDYASCDAYFTYMRGDDLINILQAQPLATDMIPGFASLHDYFHVIESPFTRVLWKMERTGIPVDMDRVRKIDGPLRDGINEQRVILRKLAGREFNPNAPEDVRELLYGKKGFNLAAAGYTKKTGVASTSEKDLKNLQNRVKDQKVYDIIEAILAFKHLDKLHGTYVKKIHEQLGPDGRIHCSLNQALARTGRLSASGPNLQNIPIRSDEFHIRSMFCAPTGMKFLDADYPQIQPRLAALFAEEEVMLEGIRKNWDMHSANAANMYGRRDPERFTYANIESAKRAKDARQRDLTDFEKSLLRLRDGAKTVGLGVLFGEGPQKMAHQLRISVDDAKELIATFFGTYPKLQQLIYDTHDSCHEHEAAWTMLGRYRRLHQINNDYNRGAVAAEERAGFNHLIQGSEVEVMKCAMLQIDASPDWHALGGELCMTVHDELMAFAPSDTAEDCLGIMTGLMSRPLRWGPVQLELGVDLTPDGGIGNNWAEAH